MAKVMSEDDDSQQSEIVIVEEGERNEAQATDSQQADARDEDPDDEDGDDDARGHEHDQSDEDREALRERRRLEKIERKRRREEAIRRDKLERDFLLQRNDQLERQFNEFREWKQNLEVSSISDKITAAANEMKMAEQVIAKAIAAGNGDDVTQALRYRDEARARMEQLSGLQHQLKNQPRQAQQAQGPAPEMVEHARKFMSELPWYKLNGTDEDSAIVAALDSAVSAEGYNPNTPAYWDELRRRVEKRMPDKFQKPERQERQARGGPALGSGRDGGAVNGRVEVRLDPERVQALKDLGVWDDPKLRDKFVRRYMEYDKENRNNR